MAEDERWSRLETISIIITILLSLFSIFIAWLSSQRGWVIGLAVSVGALGGLVHELAQSGGKILWFQRKLDGFYMGSLSGMILGAVSGILIVRGVLVDNAPFNSTALTFEIFSAGLALKGIVEAATGKPLPEGAQPVTQEQAAVIHNELEEAGA